MQNLSGIGERKYETEFRQFLALLQRAHSGPSPSKVEYNISIQPAARETETKIEPLSKTENGFFNALSRVRNRVKSIFRRTTKRESTSSPESPGGGGNMRSTEHTEMERSEGGGKAWKIVGAVSLFVGGILAGSIISQSRVDNVLNRKSSDVLSILGKKDTSYQTYLETKQRATDLENQNVDFQMHTIDLKEKLVATEKRADTLEKNLTRKDRELKIARLDLTRTHARNRALLSKIVEPKKNVVLANKKIIDAKLKSLLRIQGVGSNFPKTEKGYDQMIRNQENLIARLDRQIEQANIIDWNSGGGDAATAPRSSEKVTHKTLKPSYAKLKKLVSEAHVDGGQFSIAEMRKGVHRIYFRTDGGRTFYLTAEAPNNARYISQEWLENWGKRKLLSKPRK